MSWEDQFNLTRNHKIKKRKTNKLMASKSHMVSGTASYAKILGNPVPGYQNGPAEWTVDLILDKDGIKQYKESKGDPFYVKTNKDTGAQYLRFKRHAKKKDGTDGKPILVVGPDGQPWDQSKLIGNGSILNVRFGLNEVPSQGTKRLKPSVIAIQVWEHSPYEGRNEFPTRDVPVVDEENWDESDS